jgi:hypothetical protein
LAEQVDAGLIRSAAPGTFELLQANDAELGERMRELAARAGSAGDDNDERGNSAANQGEGHYERGRHRAGSEKCGAIVNVIVFLAMVFVVSDFISRRIDPFRRGAPICRHNACC